MNHQYVKVKSLGRRIRGSALHCRRMDASFLIVAFFSLLFISCEYSLAQSKNKPNDSSTLHSLIIRHINIEGNNRTRRQTILREMTLVEGDSVPADKLMKDLEVSKNQVQ